MKIFTRILFALFVVFMSVDIRMAYGVSCSSGTFFASLANGCKPCPAGCGATYYLPDGGYECQNCVGAPSTTFACLPPMKPTGFYCPGTSDSATDTGLKTCNAAYPYSDLGNAEEGKCYVMFEFDIGKGATFHTKTADSNGKVSEKMYYTPTDGDETVFLYIDDKHHLKGDYITGDSKPKRKGHIFLGWKMKRCGENWVDDVNINTDIEPLWSQISNDLCTKFQAKWTCAEGWYRDGEDCTQCPNGMTTSGDGENSLDDCDYIFKYSGGTWKWPYSIGPIVHHNPE